MNSAIERLLTLRVRDIMRQHVISVRGSDTLADAADVFEQNEITGAPVIDDAGRCLGVLSSSDFVYRERLATGPTTSSVEDGPALAARSDLDMSATAPPLVMDFMTPMVQTISPDAPIMAAARLMCAEHIHRLVVMDRDQRPLGILSSLDLVASMVVAVEE